MTSFIVHQRESFSITHGEICHDRLFKDIACSHVQAFCSSLLHNSFQFHINIGSSLWCNGKGVDWIFRALWLKPGLLHHWECKSRQREFQLCQRLILKIYIRQSVKKKIPYSSKKTKLTEGQSPWPFYPRAKPVGGRARGIVLRQVFIYATPYLKNWHST